MSPAVRLVGLALCSLVLALPAGARAAELSIAPAAGAKFPDRDLVLTLPEQRVVGAGDVTVTENGKPVEDLSVVPAGEARSFQTMLAIDASLTMRDGAIEGAVAAARAFAARRPADQALGVLFFSHGARVALSPTTDKAAIDAALATPPALTKGTRLTDAAYAAVDALADAGAEAGTVVVFADGEDVGSVRSVQETAAAARAAGVRLFTVGLRSILYDPATLRGLAEAGHGTYAEAAEPDQLKPVFEALAQRLAGEYVVSYRSRSPLGSAVAVEASVAGMGNARTSYQSPPLGADAKAGGPSETWWTGAGAMLAVVLLVAAMIGIGFFLAMRPRPMSIHARINEFVVPPRRRKSVGQALDPRQAMSILAGAEKSLERNRRWSRFAGDVDVARMRQSPVALAAAAALGTMLLVWFLAVPLERPLVAGVMLLAIPFAVRKVVAIRAERTRQAFAAQLVDNLQVVVSAMRAGHSFTGALSVAVEDAAEPARSELRRAVQDEQLGVPVEEALHEVARRMNNEELEYVGLVAALQRNTGGNTAEVVERLIESIRHRTDLRRLVKTLTAQGRISGAVVTGLPIALTLVMNVVSPGFSDPMLESTAGRIAMVMTAGAVGLGWLIIRKIVDIKV